MPTFLSYPSQKSAEQSARSKHCLVYFVTGNPGLVDYYEPFLSTLRSLLDETEAHTRVAFHIYGRNLAGFDDNDHEPFNEHHVPFDLDYQIRHVIEHLLSIRIESGPRKGTTFDEIILVGHSVGTYIALEVFHRHLRQPQLATSLPLKAGVLLFATISHLAQSPRGLYLDRIRSTPFFNRNAHRLAKGFLWLWPPWALRLYIRHVLGFPQHATEATMHFLMSRDGIWQALHLGKDELRVIADDVWVDELWEVAVETATQRHELPKFFIFFGKQDHWVADEYRDEFIKRRQKHKKSRTRIMIDEGNLPHDFCISHSETVAEKVKGWIDEIAEC